jgi:predicted RNA-binding protein with PUA-like domain
VEQNKNPIGIGPYSLLQPYYLISNLVKYRNAMAYWLVKSEPFKYSWEQFVADKVTYWDGVRNYAARNNLRAMKKGDRVLFYHSNEGLEIVGIAKVVKEYYQDPTTNDAAWSVVDLKAEKKLKNPVSLQKIKLEKRLANMQIIKLSRLSVTAVTEEEWFTILEMSETK